jgi:hypothetical protein
VPSQHQNHQVAAVQLTDKPAPPPRRPRAHFLSAREQLTSRSCQQLGSRKGAARGLVGSVVRGGSGWFRPKGLCVVRKRSLRTVGVWVRRAPKAPNSQDKFALRSLRLLKAVSLPLLSPPSSPAVFSFPRTYDPTRCLFW